MLELLNSEKIYYHEIYYFLSDVDKKKIPIGEKNNITIDEIEQKNKTIITPPKTYYSGGESKKISKSELKTLTSAYTIFIKHTPDLFCIDIDDENITHIDDLNEKILSNCPWVSGNTKGIHIYIKILNTPNYTNQQDVYEKFKGDLIKKNNMWERKDKVLHNFKGKIPEIEFIDIKHIFNDKIFNFKLVNVKPAKTIKAIKAVKTKIVDTIDDNDTNKDDEHNNKINNVINIKVIKISDVDMKLIECISIKRSDAFVSWISMGRLYKNIYGYDYGFMCWCEFSKKSSKFLMNEWENNGLILNKHYTTFKNDNSYDISILYKIACKDNPVLFYKYFNDYFKKNRNQNNDLDEFYNFNFKTSSISDYFLLIYGDIFIFYCDDLYYFNGIYWVMDSKRRAYLHTFIERDFKTHLKEYSNTFMIDTEEKLKNKTKLTKMIDMLGHQTHRTAIIENILNKITNNSIVFDKDPYHFCFLNKLFDLKTNEFIVSDPKFYIKTTCRINYDDNYDVKNIEYLNNLIIKIFADEEIRTFYLKNLSSGLYGESVENMFICTGGGANGKSFMHSLMLFLVGDYGYKMQSSVLSENIKNGANPQISNLNNKRFVLVQEPSINTKIQGSLVKEITGDSTINSRGLYSSDCEIRLKLSLFLEANKIPMIDSIDGGVKRRLRIIPFESQFLNDDDYDNRDVNNLNIYRADANCKTDLFKNTYAQALFEILRHNFKLFMLDELKIRQPPLQCLHETTDFLESSDPFYQWFSNTFTLTKERVEPIKIKDIYKNIFLNSNYFNNLEKRKQNDFTEREFVQIIKNNVFLNSYLKEQYTFNGTRYECKIMVNHILKS